MINSISTSKMQDIYFKLMLFLMMDIPCVFLFIIILHLKNMSVKDYLPYTVTCLHYLNDSRKTDIK